MRTSLQQEPGGCQDAAYNGEQPVICCGLRQGHLVAATVHCRKGASVIGVTEPEAPHPGTHRHHGCDVWHQMIRDTAETDQTSKGHL